jgi:hypothetical protein
MPEVEYRPAWKRSDPVIERDAEILWRCEKALRPTANVTTNLSSLCAAAYRGNELVATALVSARPISNLRCRLAMYRCFVAREMRERGIATGLTIFSRDLMEAWSREHPSEQILGLGAIIRSRMLVQNLDMPVYPKTKLALVGYSRRGFQIRVYWFEHARISKYWPGFQLEDTDSDDADEFENVIEG